MESANFAQSQLCVSLLSKMPNVSWQSGRDYGVSHQANNQSGEEHTAPEGYAWKRRDNFSALFSIFVYRGVLTGATELQGCEVIFLLHVCLPAYFSCSFSVLQVLQSPAKLQTELTSPNLSKNSLAFGLNYSLRWGVELVFN